MKKQYGFACDYVLQDLKRRLILINRAIESFQALQECMAEHLTAGLGDSENLHLKQAAEPLSTLGDKPCQ